MKAKTNLGGAFTFVGTSLTVNRIGYGAMQLAGQDGDKRVWGPPPDVPGAIALRRESVAWGVNHIDASDYYRHDFHMLHEAAHILHDEQQRDAAWEMQRWYDESRATTSQYAKGLMQESWATAVGNGYLYEQFTGTLNPGSWYGQKYISQAAKQVLPLMRPYLEASRPMDRALVGPVSRERWSAVRPRLRRLSPPSSRARRRCSGWSRHRDWPRPSGAGLPRRW
jgi:hypothetical protein